jgi:hypothetical protein
VKWFATADVVATALLQGDAVVQEILSHALRPGCTLEELVHALTAGRPAPARSASFVIHAWHLNFFARTAFSFG